MPFPLSLPQPYTVLNNEGEEMSGPWMGTDIRISKKCPKNGTVARPNMMVSTDSVLSLSSVTQLMFMSYFQSF